MGNNKHIKMSMWLLTALITTTAYTETELTSGDSSKTQVSSQPTIESAISQGVSSDIVLDTTYSPPTISTKQIKLVYPREQVLRGREGWVQLNMMVDRQGKPYAISVVDSTGSQIFEKAAIQAVSDYQFKPATLNGELVDAGYALKFKFAIQGLEKGASEKFARRYRALTDAVQRGDRAAADEALELMTAQNLYEDAFYNLGRANYFLRWGDDKKRLEALRRAIAYEQSSKFLPEKDFQFALAQLFELQLQTKDFGGALQTFDRFDKAKKNDPKYLQLIANIKALANDANAYSVQGEIDTGTSWFYRPLKRHLSILVSEGALAEIKLRCERKYVFARYQPGKDYTIADDYGVCDMELVGDNGTKFTLIQS